MKFRDPFGLLTDEEEAIVEGLLERYKGHLSIRQIAEGIRLSLLNARELFDDANLLLASNRLARGMAILIAAMEEIGKVSVLSAMSRIPNTNQKLWADAWESFRSHRHKSTWSFASTYPEEARAYPTLLVTAACQQLSLAGVCERLRQYGFYVDFHATERRWLSPAEVSEVSVAQWRERAEIALSRAEACAEAGFFSEKALEIQREVYAEFNADRPRRRDTQPEDLAKAVTNGPRLAKTYFRRLTEAGVISPDVDLSVLGVPLSELSEDEESGAD